MYNINKNYYIENNMEINIDDLDNVNDNGSSIYSSSIYSSVEIHEEENYNNYYINFGIFWGLFMITTTIIILIRIRI